MKAQEFFRDVERGDLRPFYYLYGPERGLIEEALNKIKEKALNPATREFNFEILDAKEHTEETILASFQIFPVRSPRRLVVIQQADLVWNKATSSYIDYFLSPNPLTCAVFLGEKADLRTKFFQALEKKGATIPFYPPSEGELIHWIHLQIKQLDHQISEEAVALLMERVGPNLKELKLELQKLALRKRGEGQIAEEDVLNLTEDMRSENPFEFPPAVARLDLKGMLRLLRKNLQQGEPPLLLFLLTVRQLRLIRRAQDLKSGGCSKKEIETRLRIFPRKAEDFWEQVENFPLSSLDQLWLLNLEADQKLKTSYLEKGLLLEKYLWDLYFHGLEGWKAARAMNHPPGIRVDFEEFRLGSSGR